MSVFQSEVNALAGAGGEGVKEQCRYNNILLVITHSYILSSEVSKHFNELMLSLIVLS